MPPKLIETKALSFRYQETPILEEITISIEQGEFIGIFGPNGGGKTTFLKLLLGLLKPSSGTIQIEGKPPKSAQKKIGYVPQATFFDRQFPISVFEVVLSGCLSKLHPLGFFSKESKAEAEAALSRVGLLAYKSQAFGTLSGGQMQRLLIARALVSNPEILFLDEPTSSVDIQAEEMIYELLDELKGKMTILMITHDLKSIASRAGRLFCIQKRLMPLSPAEACEHFALGLYHPPLNSQQGPST